ncbi:alpha/beta fold hydrolase [Puniceicoccaceae bacterium K14]|nr:alpha/beta fold hydrolase [Puniceicoccaceae bacterium K14]
MDTPELFDGVRENVVLLHGLTRSSDSMRGLETFLEKCGYRVHNLDYPSTKFSIEELVAMLRPKIEEIASRSSRIHFVTHSMGGILIRFLLKEYPISNLGRVVMLSPPNNGSEVVDKLGHWKAFRKLNGPAGQQLGTDSDSLPCKLGAVEFELGIITGDRSINWLLSLLIQGPNDGKVSIESAKVEGMKAFAVVHATHPYIMKKDVVFRKVQRFLQQGDFEIK